MPGRSTPVWPIQLIIVAYVKKDEDYLTIGGLVRD